MSHLLLLLRPGATMFKPTVGSLALVAVACFLVAAPQRAAAFDTPQCTFSDSGVCDISSGAVQSHHCMAFAFAWLHGAPCMHAWLVPLG